MSKTMEKEYRTISTMIALYCEGRHRTPKGDPCSSCRELLPYAKSRLDKCPLAEDKPTCANCTVHCYKPERRKEIQQVMRYAGPRMMRSHPILAVGHLARKFQKPRILKS